MNRTKYNQEKNKLISYYRNEFSFEHTGRTEMQFNIVSASLGNYLPAIDHAQHEAIYNDILLNKKLSILEQSAWFLADELQTENLGADTLRLLKKGPSIVCTFHTGSYRMINHFLVKQQVPFTLVMGNAVIEKEGQLFFELYQRLQGARPDALRLLNAEDPRTGLQMLRELKSGRVLVLYIDGNTGAGSNTRDNANHCVVDLLTQQVYARKGIAYLAHAAQVPILPVACYRTERGAISLRFFDLLFPEGKDRQLFASTATQRIYDLIAPMIRQYPEQWEGWLYIHHMAMIQPVADESFCATMMNDRRLHFNRALFGIFKVNDTPFLIRKKDYSFYEIDRSLYELLKAAPSRSIYKACFEEDLFNQLYRYRVLVDEAI
ncbi:LpxL/LpxP family acyltransferase [Terrimonas alba]|uniref:LpxL/LpxP family acyltransferase n=1 Tax=Terrimonas alba TaxID=3349636 RepID=UPI0035F4B10C